MLKRLREALAELLESLKKPREIKEQNARPAGKFSFRFTHEDRRHDVTVYCNMLLYSCEYTGIIQYVRTLQMFEVYCVVTGDAHNSELSAVFAMTIIFPPIGNWLCTPKQQAAVAIEAYVCVITQRFKDYLNRKSFTA